MIPPFLRPCFPGNMFFFNHKILDAPELFNMALCEHRIPLNSLVYHGIPAFANTLTLDLPSGNLT